MRKALNRLLYRWGYRLERLSPFTMKLEQLSKHKGPLKFIQIGANDGIRFDGLYEFVTSHRCVGIVVEPLPDLWEKLRSNYSDYPDIVPIKKAIHGSARLTQIYRVSPGDMGSLPDWTRGIASFNKEHLLLHGVPAERIVSEDVECIPLMQLLAETNCLDADFIQIDAEGFDIAIMRMMDFARFKPELIKYEHKNAPLEDQHEIEAALRRQGYKVRRHRGDTVAWRTS